MTTLAPSSGSKAFFEEHLERTLVLVGQEGADNPFRYLRSVLALSCQICCPSTDARSQRYYHVPCLDGLEHFVEDPPP